MSLSYNGLKAMQFACLCLVVITGMIGISWVMSPSEFTVKLETDDNTLELLNQTLSYQEDLCHSKSTEPGEGSPGCVILRETLIYQQGNVENNSLICCESFKDNDKEEPFVSVKFPYTDEAIEDYFANKSNVSIYCTPGRGCVGWMSHDRGTTT